MSSNRGCAGRTAALLAALLLGALAAPTVSGAAPTVAQQPVRDSVTGNVTTVGSDVPGFEVAAYDISATSGPSGESPTGQVVATSNGPFFTGPVQCLSVHDNVALMTVQSESFGLLALRVTDNAGLGPADLVEATIASRGTDCSLPESSYIRHDRVTSGDIVVIDAQPLPTSKEQCKNGGWRSFGDTFENQG